MITSSHTALILLAVLGAAEVGAFHASFQAQGVANRPLRARGRSRSSSIESEHVLPAAPPLPTPQTEKKPHHHLRVPSLKGYSAVELANKLREKLPYLTRIEADELQQALSVGIIAHTAIAGQYEGWKRVEAAVSSCLMLAEYEVDVETLVSCMLLNTVEPQQRGISAKDLERRFGVGVAKMVASYDRVNRLVDLAKQFGGLKAPERDASLKSRKGSFSEQDDDQVDALRNLILSEVDDWRVLILRIITHLQRVGSPTSESEQRELSQESFLIWSPLASRLGFHGLKIELQEAAFKCLYPLEYSEVKTQMNERSGLYDAVLNEVSGTLTAAFEADETFMSQLDSLTLSGRTKSSYSMWRKMSSRGVSVDNVLDAVALRVVVKPRRLPLESDASYEERSNHLCYEALSKVQSMYETMESRLKDYIAYPKANGYRSLHLTARMDIASHSLPFEVQIRTSTMHQKAEWGVAAHFVYKEGRETNYSYGYTTPPEIVSGKEYVDWVHGELQRRKVFVFVDGRGIWALDKNVATIGQINNLLTLSNFYTNKILGRNPVDIAVNSRRRLSGEIALKNGDFVTAAVLA